MCANFKFPTTYCSFCNRQEKTINNRRWNARWANRRLIPTSPFCCFQWRQSCFAPLTQLNCIAYWAIDDGLRAACEFPQVPHRKTIARRLSQLVPAAEEQIRLGGRQIIAQIAAPDESLTSAIDGRMYEAVGARWHAKHRRENRIPPGLRNVDTDSYWSKSDYRGWVQGLCNQSSRSKNHWQMSNNKWITHSGASQLELCPAFT